MLVFFVPRGAPSLPNPSLQSGTDSRPRGLMSQIATPLGATCGGLLPWAAVTNNVVVVVVVVVVAVVVVGVGVGVVFGIVVVVAVVVIVVVVCVVVVVVLVVQKSNPLP